MSLDQIISKYGKPLNYGYPAKIYTKKEIIKIFEEWLKQQEVIKIEQNHKIFCFLDKKNLLDEINNE